VQHPAKYYQNNVVGSHSLLTAMLAADVCEVVFSSTTATYGIPDVVPIREDETQRPINPYGFTKLVIEQMLRDYQRAYGMRYAALRYFNASGAAEDGSIGEDHRPESHLIPIVLQVALGQREGVTVFGDDYPTPDGTCIRDYVHVDDLATAHLAAMRKLDTTTPDSIDRVEVNLGTGKGHSVNAVLEACRRVSNHEIPSDIGQRRAGDPPELVADPSLAKQQLGWQPRYVDLEGIVETAWRWHRDHPHGYA
jgi:UDP-glucose 4-epimerase